MNYDVLVIGGGHAGVEAAVMARRLKMKVAIVTFSANDIGVMSCNPAMGGLGKGHLIREVSLFENHFAFWKDLRFKRAVNRVAFLIRKQLFLL